MQLFHHSVQFYDDDQAFARAVSSYVAAGRQAGAEVLLITTPVHLCQIHALLSSGAESAGESPLYADAEETLSDCMRGELPSEARFFRRFERVIGAAVRRRPLWIVGELVGVLSGQGRHAAALGVEDLWNRLAARHVFSLLCVYPLRSFVTGNHTDAFLEVCRAHNHIVAGPESMCPGYPSIS